MSQDRKPLVLSDSAQLQQLQAADDLDIPLNGRVLALEQTLKLLIGTLAAHGIELPDELINYES